MKKDEPRNTRKRVNPNGLNLVVNVSADVNLAFSEALTRFVEITLEKARLVKMRFCIGLTNEEAAKAMGISLATTKWYWNYIRAWLLDAIQKDRSH